MLLSQGEIEYRNGAVSCSHSHFSHNLKVYLGESYEADKVNVPIIGNYKSEDDTASFTPLIPFQFGLKYLGFCNTEKLVFEVPIPDHYEIPNVIQIYPSADTLPSNLLKFHVQFSRPMSRIGYIHVELSDENGKTIERAILKEIPELWNDNHTKLTIWIEPGRIKRGLGPNMELGPVLNQTNSYSLFISSHFLDQNGVRLDQDYSKHFVVKEADREKLSINDVLLNFYAGDKFNYLSVTFGEAVDFSSSISNMTITDSNNEVINGGWKLTDGEKEAIFTPFSKLATDKYNLILNSLIEDHAGNNFMRNFDQEIDEKLKKDQKKQFILSFEVK